MELKKLAPWNWSKKEEEFDHSVPVKHRNVKVIKFAADNEPHPLF